MKKIYLHIGAHKTGTTAIQEALTSLQKEGELKKHDFCFMLLSDEIHTLCHTTQNKEQFCTIFQHKLAHFIENTPFQNFIFSFEGLSSSLILANPHIVEALANVFSPYHTTIIYYLRRQDSAYESLWAQRHKHFLSSLHLDPPKSIYKDVLALYAKYFGKENICLRIYDKKSLYKNNSVSDFLEYIQLADLIDIFENIQNKNLTTPAQEQEKTLSKNANSSMSPYNLRISLSYQRQNTLSQEASIHKKKQLEQSQHKPHSESNNNIESSQTPSPEDLYNLHADFLIIEHGIDSNIAFAETLQKLYALSDKDKPVSHAYMPPHMREKFLCECQEENAYIMREYLDKEEGTLFDMSMPQETVSLESPSTDDLVQSFLPMLVDLKQSIETLKKENKNYLEQIQVLQEDNKKINKILSTLTPHTSTAQCNLKSQESPKKNEIIRLGKIRKG